MLIATNPTLPTFQTPRPDHMALWAKKEMYIQWKGGAINKKEYTSIA